MQILLDTCTFLWVTIDAPELSGKAKACFRNPENTIYFSPVSAWEIIVKNRLGKLPLPENPAEFISRQCRNHKIEFLELDILAVYQLETLPDLHRDPFDRILICQAMHKRLTILTSDKMISLYSVDTLW